MRRAVLAAALLALAAPAAARAHGIGGVGQLPLPLSFALATGAVVLTLSFVGLGVLWRRPVLAAGGHGRPLPEPLQEVLFAPALRVALGTLSFALLAVVFAAALAGDRSPSDNIAPTFVYVVFWLGGVALSLLLGNVWRVIGPWRAAADAVAWLWERSGRTWEPLPYPERLGRWPAAALLLAFATLELAYSDPSDPRALAGGILAYSGITWLGALLFGREAWFDNGDGFSVYFGLFSRVAPFGVEVVREQLTVVLRRPLSALAAAQWRPGSVPVLAVMLGSVGFDGFSGTRWWQEAVFEVQAPYLANDLDVAELLSILTNLGGLLAVIGLVGLTYRLAVAAAQPLLPRRSRLAAVFVGSLVPIALVYAIAHYFGLFILQGQETFRLASDPFGWEWNLFGSVTFRANLGILSPDAIWYTEVVALIVGHVVGLVVAHDRAVALARSGTEAVVSQMPMLLLMVLYTLTGLWLLSQAGG